MARDRIIPADPLDFIRGCVRRRSVLWTYHVNMRMKDRAISRETIFAAESAYEIIESYPADKYLPSYLVFLRNRSRHVPCLVRSGRCRRRVRVVTAYSPDPSQWSSDLKNRRRS